MAVRNASGIQLGPDKLGNRVHGPRPVQRHNGRQVFNGLRPHSGADAGDPGRLQLEHAGGPALRQHRKGCRVVVRNRLHIKARLRLPDFLLRVVDHSQVPQAEKIHFQQPQLLQGRHGILGDHRVIIPRQRHVIVDRQSGDHHARGMGGGIAGHPFQGLRCVDEIADPLVALIHGTELRGNPQRIVQRDVQRHGRHQLGHGVRFRIGKIQRTAHIADRTAGRHRAEGNNLRHMICAVLFHHVVNHFTAAILAEIHIDIRHADPLRVQEAFKHQIVFDRIQIRNIQAIGDDRAGRAAAARPHRDSGLPCKLHKVRHNEKIVHISHLLNHLHLVFQLLPAGLRRFGIPFFESLQAELAEVLHIGEARRQLELRQMIGAEGKLHLAAVGDGLRLIQRLLKIGKELPHLLFAFQIKFVCFKFHPVRVVHCLLHLNAHQHILQPAVFPAEVVRIIGRHQRQTRFPGNPQNALVGPGLHFQAVILYFQVIPVLKNIRILQRLLFRAFIVILQNQLRDFPGHTGR